MNEQVSVLLVEDNPHDRELVLRVFRRGPIGERVAVANDGAEALDFLFCEGVHRDRNASEMPRVIFLDLKLPRIGGIEVLRALRTDPRTHRIPVVIVTSSHEDRDLAESYELGANSYVVKPIEPDAFSRTMGEMGSYWTTVNRAVR